MALILDKCVILHAPKTGGTWVREALDAAGVAYRLSGGDDSMPPSERLAASAHHDREDVRHVAPKLPRIAFVRHPASLLKSWWAHRTLHGWTYTDAGRIDACGEEGIGFQAFIDRYLEDCPGEVSRMLDRYTGPEENPVMFVGRQERLRDDLLAFLTTLRVEFDASAVRSFPNCNVATAAVEPQPEYRVDQLSRIMDVDARTIERWGYV